MNPQTFVFIGRSGCGKGTQAKLLTDYLKKNDTSNRGLYYIETGAEFRKLIQGNSLSSRLSKETYEQNERQCDFLAIWMWSHMLVENITGEEHVIFDGAPRSELEAMAMNSALDFYKRKANIVYINVSRVLSERRLLERGRKDDLDMKMIARRLDWFDKDVVPAIEYFREQSKHNFIEVNGEQGLENVHAEIVSRIALS